MDPQRPLWLVEGQTRADALMERGVAAVAITGCWNWSQDGGPVPDFDILPVTGRRVFVAFDGDVLTKKQIGKAALRLAEALTERGAVL